MGSAVGIARPSKTSETRTARRSGTPRATATATVATTATATVATTGATGAAPLRRDAPPPQQPRTLPHLQRRVLPDARGCGHRLLLVSLLQHVHGALEAILCLRASRATPVHALHAPASHVAAGLGLLRGQQRGNAAQYGLCG